MKLVITMSRRYGTGASIIAKELSEKLGIPVYDKAYIEEQLSGHKYESEAEAIRKLAEQPCIILGRCASDILKGRPDVFNIFIRADKEDRIRRIMKLYNLEEKKAIDKIKKTDRERRIYYESRTGREWGSIEANSMMFNVSLLGIDGAVDALEAIYRKWESRDR